MVEVDNKALTEVFEAYKRAMETNNALVKQVAQQLIQDYGRVPPKTFIKEYENLIYLFSNTAATASKEYYQEARDLYKGLDEYIAEVPPLDTAAAGEWVQELTRQDKDPQTLINEAGNQSITFVMQASDKTFEHNAKRDRAHPLFALVPHIGACSWCVMHGSRGFVFSSKEVVSNVRHPHCRCTTAISFAGIEPSIAGYDPSRLRQKYQSNTGFIRYLNERDKHRKRSN